MLYVVFQSLVLVIIAKYSSGSIIKNAIENVWKMNIYNISSLITKDLMTVFNTVKIVSSYFNPLATEKLL